MSDLLTIINKIKIKPGMYIGTTNVNNLFMFLVGYKTARQELGIKLNELEILFYREFQPWLQKRLGIETVNSWAKIISFYCLNEQEAFNYFFELFEEFLQENLDNYNQFTESNNNKSLEYSAPKKD